MALDYARMRITPQRFAALRQQHAPDMTPPQSEAWVTRESGGNPDAVGPKTKWGHARGLTQLLDATAKEMGVTNIHDPEQNVIGGLKYWQQGYNREGNAIGAFNYYHGGPNKKIWGPKTNAYSSAIVGASPTVQDYANNIAAKREDSLVNEQNPGMPAINQANQGLRDAYYNEPRQSWKNFGNIMQQVQARNKQLMSNAAPAIQMQAMQGTPQQNYNSLLNYTKI